MLKNTLSVPSKMCLYDSYVMSYFTYCSAIWHNCNESDKQMLERLNLNMRALRCVYNKQVPFHGDDDYGLTLSNRRLQDVAILIFKAVNGMLPGYISDLFVVRNNVTCLRGTNKLFVLHLLMVRKCRILYRMNYVQRQSIRNLRML